MISNEKRDTGGNMAMVTTKRKIFVAECKQEVSTFNPVPSRYADFEICSGEDLIWVHQDREMEMGGALRIFGDRQDVEVVPGYSARAVTSGGTLSAPDFERIAAEFLTSVKNAKGVDGVYFSLHGAMAAENESDPEGHLLTETRRVLGTGIPIVISLDLHGVLTDRMLEHCEAATVFHTYPHDDFYDTGARAAKALLGILDGKIKPVMARVPVPALVRGNELITESGSLGEVMHLATEFERSARGVAAAMMIGNPFTDVPDLCSNALVIADGDMGLAERTAVEIATTFWTLHEGMTANLTALDEAIAAASDIEGTVVFYDPADATSSGASGDSNAILRGLLDAHYRGRVLLPVVDPGAVAQARAAGIGAVIETYIGGSLDSGRFSPLKIKAKVRTLSDGELINESHGTVWNAGDTAVLKTGSTIIVATSRAVSLYDRSLFLSHGQDPERFDLVVVKSPHCRHQFFDDWAEKTFNVDVPGSTSADLKSLGHSKCIRPIFPLDSDVRFKAKARIYQ
jgi:microcystin degradation protein MlrC